MCVAGQERKNPKTHEAEEGYHPADSEKLSMSECSLDRRCVHMASRLKLGVWTPNVLAEGPPERRSRAGNQEAQLLGGPSRAAG